MIGHDVGEDQPTMNCPKCGAEYDDFDGFGVLFCPTCRFCKHASRDDGVCNYCGAADEVKP